mmetsp:Transcript_28012/g.67505  ORF Transcript_28012/g.67505 Transcript_28012/m.67505 type:complete len:438 (-) Transcript_28012:137-1450(-)
MMPRTTAQQRKFSVPAIVETESQSHRRVHIRNWSYKPLLSITSCLFLTSFLIVRYDSMLRRLITVSGGDAINATTTTTSRAVRIPMDYRAAELSNGTATTIMFDDSAVDAYETSDFWDSLDLKGEIDCGRCKCLFRQKITASNDNKCTGDGENCQERVGYLVGSNYQGYQFETETRMAWRLANYLKSKFGIRHMLLDEPRKVIVSPSALEVFHNRTNKGPKRQQMYTGGQYATVQKVRIVPDANWFIFKINNQSRATLKWLYREKVVNKTSFAITFKKDVERTLNVLNAVPLLACDFQMIVGSGGNIYQFDFERAFLGIERIYRQGFENRFPMEYDKAISFLRRLRGWSDGNKETAREDDYPTKGSVLRGYLNRTSSLSCEALDTVNNMSGRIGEERRYTRAGRLMMILLVQMVIFDTRHDDIRPEGMEDGMWNCSV